MKHRALYFVFLSVSFFFACSEKDNLENIRPEELEEGTIIRLTFKNYLDNSENIHPKVLYFENGWNGFSFWMAYTPYPLGDITAENPCIGVSSDGLEWFVPGNLVNPLASVPDNGYNSDTHLVYDEENDRMELWWRTYDNDLGDSIYRRISQDGENWTSAEIVIDFGEIPGLILSPAVWKEGNSYIMVYSDGFVLKSMEGYYLDSSWYWNDPETISVDWQGKRAWHQDVIKREDGNWIIIVQAFNLEENNNSSDLYYVLWDPVLQEASHPVGIVNRGEAGKFDERSVYRSSVVKVNDKYYLYYSCIDDAWHRHMMLKVIPLASF